MRGYRKFAVALVGVVGTQVLSAPGLIEDGVYSTVVIAVTVAYLASNVMKPGQKAG